MNEAESRCAPGPSTSASARSKARWSRASAKPSRPATSCGPRPACSSACAARFATPTLALGVEQQGGETDGIDLLAQLAVLGIGALQTRTDLQRAREVRQQGLQQPPFAPFVGAGGGAAAQVQPRAGRAGLAEATDQRVLVEGVDAILAVVLAALEFRARHEVLVAVHAARLHACVVQRVQRAEGVVVEPRQRERVPGRVADIARRFAAGGVAEHQQGPARAHRQAQLVQERRPALGLQRGVVGESDQSLLHEPS